MPINGVILQKLGVLDQVLAELRSLGAITARQLESDWKTRRAVERDLQILVEIVNRRLCDFEQFRDEVLAHVQG